MEENKQQICNLLMITLQATSNAVDVIGIEYDAECEIVTVTFLSGGTRKINVACDSGTAMIRDIMKGLGV